MHLSFQLLVFTMIKLVIMVFLGVTLGKIMEKKGWTRFFHRFTCPLLLSAHLPLCCEGALIMAPVSGPAGEALIALHYQNRELTPRQVILASMILNLPLFFSFLPTLAAIVYPLIGWVGLLYLASQALARLLLMLTAVAIGHFALPVPGHIEKCEEEEAPTLSAAKKALTEAAKTTLRILSITGPVMGLVFYLVNTGFFRELPKTLASRIHIPGLSTDALAITAAHTLHIAGGAAVAAGLLDAHLVKPKEVLLAMILGNALGTPLRSARNALPEYLAFYPPKLALAIAVCTQGLRTIILIGLYYLILHFW